MIGRTLGGLRIIEQIGMGGMATVYKAYDPGTDRHVALKVIPEAYSKDPRYLQRFRREARAIAKLEHLHILPIHAYGEEDGITYLVMRYLQTGTLADRIQQGPIPYEEVSRIMNQLGSALDYAHKLGVLHRDIKPSNVLLDTDGNVFLTDFGIAKMVEASLDLTDDGGILGTPAYMSPEQCMGISSKLTPATDQYSLGVVLYEMLTGRTPYQAETPLAVIYKQINQEPLPLPRSLRPDLPEAVEMVVLKALAREPEHRFENCSALAAAFDRAIAGQPFDAAETPPAHRAPDMTEGLTSPDVLAGAIAQPTPPPASERKRRAAPIWLLLGGALGLITLAGIVAISAWVFGREWFQNRNPDLTTQASAEPSSATDTSTSGEAGGSTLAPVAPSFSGNTPEGAVARLGRGPVDQLAVSPAGDYFAVASPLGAYLYRADSLELFRTISGDDRTTSVAFNADGSMWARGDDGGTVFTYSTDTGEFHRVFSVGHVAGITFSVAFSPDGNLVASGASDNRAVIWDLDTGELAHILKGHDDWVTVVAFNPDSSVLASGSSDNTIKFWDVNTGELSSTFEAHTDRVSDISFSPDGSMMASSSWDTTVMLWDVQSGEILQTLRGHSAAVNSVAFSQDGSALVSASLDSSVIVWDAQSGDIVRTIDDFEDGVSSAHFNANGTELLTSSGDDTVQIRNLGSGELVRELQGHTKPVNGVAFSPNEQSLVSVAEDGSVTLWDVASSEPQATLREHRWRAQTVDYSPNGSVFATGALDGTAIIWDADTGEKTHTLVANSSPDGVYDVAFSPDGTTLATGQSDGIVTLWDAHTGARLRAFEQHRGAVYGVAFSPDGKLLASASDDSTVIVWDLDTNEPLHTLTGHIRRVNAVEFSPDGQLLASASGDGDVILWDVASGEEWTTLPDHSLFALSVAFSPDGNAIATGDGSGAIYLWSATDGQLLRTLTGHQGNVSDLAFSADGSLLASSSDDGSIVLWDMQS